MKNVLVTGAGGFIAGHLVNSLVSDGNNVVAVDKKELNSWYQKNTKAENVVGDLSSYDVCKSVTENIDEVYHLACNMGGIGFIENNKTDCMLSIIPDVYMIKAATENKVKKFLFTSSACVYPIHIQQDKEAIKLSEDHAYPADPEDGYGWEKLFMERMCRHYHEDYGIDIKIARYHNVYGPYTSWNDGREKAPAAICRKIAEAKKSAKKEIEIWGDGEQTRSFLYVDDCVKATKLLMKSDINTPINIGSEDLISINNLVYVVANIADIEIEIKHIKGPLGVRGRNSDNTKINQLLNWNPEITLPEGLRVTYDWIEAKL